jgi:hypothetical protein
MQNPFTDKRLRSGAVRLLGVLMSNYTERGCWARRKTLAQMVGFTKGSVDQYLAALARLGYITIHRRRRLTAHIFISPATLAACGIPIPEKLRTGVRLPSASPTPPIPKEARPVCKTLDLNSISSRSCIDGLKDEEGTPKPNNKPLLNVLTRRGHEKSNPVVSKIRPPDLKGNKSGSAPSRLFSLPEKDSRGEPGPFSAEQRTLADEYVGQGVTKTIAECLVRQTTLSKLRANLIYAKSYTGENVSIPGLLVCGIRDGYRYPSNCYKPDPKPAKESGGPFQSFWEGERVSQDKYWELYESRHVVIG